MLRPPGLCRCRGDPRAGTAAPAVTRRQHPPPPRTKPPALCRPGGPTLHGSPWRDLKNGSRPTSSLPGEEPTSPRSVVSGSLGTLGRWPWLLPPGPEPGQHLAERRGSERASPCQQGGQRVSAGRGTRGTRCVQPGQAGPAGLSSERQPGPPLLGSSPRRPCCRLRAPGLRGTPSRDTRPLSPALLRTGPSGQLGRAHPARGPAV